MEVGKPVRWKAAKIRAHHSATNLRTDRTIRTQSQSYYSNFIFILEFCRLTMFSCAATEFFFNKRCPLHQKWWDIGAFGVLCLEWRYASVGRVSHFYMEFGLFNSGKVIAKNYNFNCWFRTANCSLFICQHNRVVGSSMGQEHAWSKCFYFHALFYKHFTKMGISTSWEILLNSVYSSQWIKNLVYTESL